MKEVSLPHAHDLMLAVLKAADQTGKARYEEIDNLAIQIADVPGEQIAVEFSDEASHTGPKIYLRTAWARSVLKRIGAMDSYGGGFWGATNRAADFLAMTDEEADSALKKAAESAYDVKEPTGEQLAEMKGAAQSEMPMSMTVRDLLSLWGAGRRWSSVNERISATLESEGLATDPDFLTGGLDQIVRIVTTLEQPVKPKSDTASALLRIGTLPSATGGIAGVTPNDTLTTAQTLMWTNDYSQLGVMNSTRDLRGAVSWESIARARLRNPRAELKDCIVEAVEVRVDTPILEAARLIKGAEYLFVRGQHNEVVGIITTMDLSDQFTALAGPFLTLGEIERLLRIPIDGVFSMDELQEVVPADDARIIDGSHALSLGEIQRLIDKPSNWERLGWPADRKVFVAALNTVREIRNEIMHFSPDPMEPGRLGKLDAFLKMMRTLVGRSHRQR